MTDYNNITLGIDEDGIWLIDDTDRGEMEMGHVSWRQVVIHVQKELEKLKGNSDDLVKQAIAELQDIVRCRCHPAYTNRGMHDPDCDCDSADAVKIVANRIEKLEADNKGLRHMILDQINSTGDDPEIMAATRAEWAARALMAEAKVAEALEAVKSIKSDMDDRDDNGAYLTCKYIIAKLEGDSDE